jgi:hypothetical protein
LFQRSVTGEAPFVQDRFNVGQIVDVGCVHLIRERRDQQRQAEGVGLSQRLSRLRLAVKRSA